MSFGLSNEQLIYFANVIKNDVHLYVLNNQEEYKKFLEIEKRKKVKNESIKFK